MPYEIEFAQLPLGYAAKASRANEEGLVLAKEFVSSEDGQLLVSRLEGFPTEILELVKPQRDFRPSEINHILAIIRKDKTCTVYINELEIVSMIRVRKGVEKGDLVYKDDVLDMGPLQMQGINIPIDSGLLFMFSVGWRKGIYLDLMPLSPNSTSRTEDIESLFGQLFRYVSFQERLNIPESDWTALFSAGWFPFNSLREYTIKKLLTAVREGWRIEEVLGDIAKDVDEGIDLMLSEWSGHVAFQGHMAILTNAIERYRAQDYISCVASLVPRIEGILRSHRQIVMPSADPSAKVGQKALAKAATSALASDNMSLLLPERFSQYLQQVYFADFDPADTDISVSRNSVGHGVANEAGFTKKSAVLSILVLHQLFYTFGTYGGDSNKEPANDGSTDQ